MPLEDFNPEDTKPSSSAQDEDPVNQFASLLAADFDDGEEQDDDDLDDAGQASDVDDDDDALDNEELDDDGDDSDDVENDDVSGQHTLNFNGQEIKVSTKELREGYLRNKDYTHKTQELAEQSRQSQAIAEQAAHERQQYQYLVGVLTQKLESMQGEEPDWATLADEDPAGYIRERAKYDIRQKQLDAARKESERLQQEEQRKFIGNLQGYARTQRDQLVAARPELADNEKLSAFQRELAGYAKSRYGFTDQELGSAIALDHRLWLILDSARQFDQLKSKGKKRADKVNKRPVLKPGSRQTPQKASKRQGRRAQERLRRTGKVSDAAAAIESLL